MKKLTFFLLLLGGMLMVWNCNQKPSSNPSPNSEPLLAIKPPQKVISIADLVLQSKLQSVDPKKMDPTWLRDVYTLREMDHNMQSQLDQNQYSKEYVRSSTCCPCGSGCCGSCDTIMMFMSNKHVHGISIVASPEKKISFKATKVGDLNVFEPTTKIPDGKYILEIETLLNPPKFSIPIEVLNKKMNLAKSGSNQ